MTVVPCRALPFSAASMRNALILLLVCGLTACASGSRQFKPELRFDPPSTEFEGLQIGRMEQWSAPLPANAEIEVINPYGDVYVRHNRGGSNFGVSGVIQRLGHDPAIENIDLRAGKDHVRVEVSYPKGIDTTPDGFNRPGRVDLAVLVPQGTTLRVRTRDGVITGKRVRANIEARSESGLINLSTTGWMDLASDSGRIQMVLIGERWNHEHKAETRSGSIEVEFPTKAPLAVHAQTSGTIKVEPEALAQHLVLDGHTLSGHWGDAPAAHRIDAKSETGDISFTLYGWMRESVADAPAGSRR
jgi:hypothetical protein